MRLPIPTAEPPPGVVEGGLFPPTSMYPETHHVPLSTSEKVYSTGKLGLETTMLSSGSVVGSGGSEDSEMYRTSAGVTGPE